MTTTTTIQRRATAPRRVRCPRCGDTGTVTTYEPQRIGRDSAGQPVYSPRHLVLVGHVCECRQGWNRGAK